MKINKKAILFTIVPLLIIALLFTSSCLPTSKSASTPTPAPVNVTDQRVAGLESSMSNIQSQVTTLKNQLKEATDATASIGSVNSKINQISADISGLQNSNKSLSDTLASAQTSNQASNKTLTDKINEVQATQKTLTDSQKTLTDNLKTLTDSLTAIKATITTLQADVTSLKTVKTTVEQTAPEDAVEVTISQSYISYNIPKLADGATYTISMTASLALQNTLTVALKDIVLSAQIYPQFSQSSYTTTITLGGTVMWINNAAGNYQSWGSITLKASQKKTQQIVVSIVLKNETGAEIPAGTAIVPIGAQCTDYNVQ